MTVEEKPADPVSTSLEPPTAEEKGPFWKGWQLALALVVGLMLVDQLSKWLAVHFLSPPPVGQGRTIVLIPGFFQLEYAENRGAAFSILYGKRWFLISVSTIASVWITWLWSHTPPKERWGRLGLSLVLAGALGNLFDRIRMGYVVDMFDAYIFGWDYPVFNVADSLIFIGVAIVLWRSFRGKV